MSDSPADNKAASTPPDKLATLVKRYRDVLSAHEGEHHAVLMQDYPDPDAISCAVAHREIAAQFDIKTSIVYAGRISHQENRALVSLLDIRLVRYQEKEFDVEQFDGVVLLDTQGGNVTPLERLVDHGIPVLITIDHHEPQERPEAEFEDIRPLAACATMLVQYIREGMLPLDVEKREHVDLATALMHGLHTETGGFIKAGRAEFHAAAYLSNYYDASVLSEVMSQRRSKVVMEVIRRALANRETRESYSISGIGYLRASDRDGIPQAADFLLTEENVHTVIVFGMVAGDDGKENVIGSLRTVKLTLDPDEMLKSAFGRGEQGDYFGGGKRMAGGFEIPVGFLSGNQDEEFRRLKWRVYDAQVRRRFFEHLGFTGDDEE